MQALIDYGPRYARAIRSARQGFSSPPQVTALKDHLNDAHDDREVVIRVSDTGKGIPAEYLPNIFDPFVTTKSKGTGMGLAVVLRIVRNYKGRIQVERSDSQGTTFCIHLPLTVA